MQVTGWKSFNRFSAFLQVTAASVSGAKSRGVMPLEWAFKIAQHYNCSTDWLMTGEGEMMRGNVVDTSPGVNLVAERQEQIEYVAKRQADFVMVPRYNVSAGAGGATTVHSEQIVDYLSFKAGWIKDVMGLSAKDLALINVKGDSMEPTLSSDDMILVDLRERKIQENAIYVLQLNGGLLVKRIQRRLDGTVIVKGDNPIYDAEVLQGEAAAMLNVIGRVVWCGRKM